MRRTASVVAAVVIALVAVAAVAAPASAHNRVVASTPAAGATLTQLPSRFSITTDQPMLVVGGSTRAFAFDVVDAEGRHYGDGCIKVVDDTMTTRAELGAPGDYEVRWQLVSADGHTVSDSYRFTWRPASAVTPSRGHADAQRCGVSAPTSGETSGPSAGGSGRGASAPLEDVLWIGGAILVVLVGAGAVLLVLTRKRPAAGAPDDREEDGPPEPPTS